jgi:hypothetical protein
VHYTVRRTNLLLVFLGIGETGIRCDVENGREVKYGDDLAELEARRYSGTLALRFTKSSIAIHREGFRKVGPTFHKSVWEAGFEAYCISVLLSFLY